MTQQLAGISLALVLVIGGAWTLRRIVQARSRVDVVKGEGIALPRSTLTPGSARAVQLAELCTQLA